MTNPRSTTTVDDVPGPVLRRAVAASALGNTTEWFDYGVYADAATKVGRNFFPGAARRCTAGRRPGWSPSPSRR